MILAAWLQAAAAWGQGRAWFVDGYHGGYYGHYPTNFTQFMVDAVREHPGWKLNLEIEPVTWDFARTNTPEAYAAFKALAADQTPAGTIEFVNPAYAQSYLWTASGESMIQQFDYGMRKIREHFPGAEFDTYSVEEPCFTSALPGVLKALGFKNAVLKNPNTCWGGYTRAFGGELVNWIGPDGTGIPTVPRYGIETLKPGSVWETIANQNQPVYLQAAFAAGIQHPVGMCLQDAGWRFGPWLKHDGTNNETRIFTTWRNYFENVASAQPTQDWHFSQEDVLVSLVWGSQVMQRLAQNVHRAENRVVAAEKLATVAGVYQHTEWPAAAFAEAWPTLLLAQHHDCWIVPYNGSRSNTWADKVVTWTGNTVQRSDDILQQSTRALAGGAVPAVPAQVRVFNTLGVARTDLARLPLPANWQGAPVVRDARGRPLPAQVVEVADQRRELLFPAAVPALGYNTFQLEAAAPADHPKPMAHVAKDGCTVVDTDLYHLVLDPAKGGTVRELAMKRWWWNRQFVDGASERRFNELRGYFYEAGKYFSTADQPAKIEILENGPVRVRLRISGQIASNAVTQVITLVQGQRRIDFNTRIDWQGKPRVGADYKQAGGFKADEDHKAFYDDRFKLLAQFPLNLKHQVIFKDAPFDVTTSRLTNTFFDTWSGIKNNILLDWVDVLDARGDVGLALLTDHTTSYAHGPDQPLGLTLLYSGVGLWGRDYRVNGPTKVNYALVPHAGDWESAALWTENDAWNEPLIAQLCPAETGPAAKSLLTMDRGGWEVPTMRLENGKVSIRLFNPSAQAAQRRLAYDGPASKVELVQLNGKVLREIPAKKDPAGRASFEVTLPHFGVGTLRITP